MCVHAFLGVVASACLSVAFACPIVLTRSRSLLAILQRKGKAGRYTFFKEVPGMPSFYVCMYVCAQSEEAVSIKKADLDFFVSSAHHKQAVLCLFLCLFTTSPADEPRLPSEHRSERTALSCRRLGVWQVDSEDRGSATTVVNIGPDGTPTPATVDDNPSGRFYVEYEEVCRGGLRPFIGESTAGRTSTSSPSLCQPHLI